MADSPSELQLEIEKLERKHAEHPEGRFFVPLANAYRKMGDIETAEALLREGVERHPDYLSAHIVLGRCLADRGAVGEAEEEFRFVLTQDPQNLIALRTLGELAVADGRPGEAAEWYRELLAVDPMNEDARQALDSLADVPAPELESEFRSGAGWWEPAADAAGAEEPPPSAAEGFEPLPGFTTAGDEFAAPADEPPFGTDTFAATGGDLAASSGEPAGPSEPTPGTREEAYFGAGEPAEPVEGVPGMAEDSYAWGGYDDLPGLRAEEPREAAPEETLESAGGAEAGLAGEEEFAPTYSHPEEPVSSSGFTTVGAGEDDEDVAHRFGDEGSSEVVTETIAELYARQGLHERAAAVYRELIRRRGANPVLEERLAEIEGLARAEMAEEEGEEEVPSDLMLADEEALVSPPVDAEEDTFASSFAHGFTTVYDETPEPALDASEPHASFPDEGVAARGGAEAAGTEEPAETFDEHPLPELAPRPAAEEPSTAPARATPSGASIVHFLSDLAAWRSTAAAPVAPPAPSAEEPRPLGGIPEATAPPIAPEGTAEAPPLEEWGGEPVDGEYGVDRTVAEPWETPAAEPAEGGYGEPWEGPALDEEEAAADLPYLEPVADSTPAGGTGPAEDEPFPWELPGAAPLTEGGEPVESSRGELDPFFVDDVEPASMRADEPLPEAAPAPEPEPEARRAQVDQSEDEDLESFQAWLRSLKR